MKIIYSMVAACTILMAADLAVAAPDVESPGGSSQLELSAPTNEPLDVRKAKFTRGWGYGLLAGGLVMNIAGAIMAEADPYGKVGLAGFIGIGVGLCHWAISFIVLGTTRPLHLPEEKAHWSPARPAVVTF